MHSLSIRLSGKRMYIAHLAARIESMESGSTAMDAVAYRLFARRMKAALNDYPAALLAAQLGRTCPSVLQAIEQRRFEVDRALPGIAGRQARSVAAALLRKARRVA
jgi:hypothetical protein